MSAPVVDAHQHFWGPAWVHYLWTTDDVGVVTESQPEDTVARALEWFGTERCTFGSDSPVSLLAVDDAETLAIVGMNGDVRGLTALRTYGREIA